MALADVPLARFLEELLIPYEQDEVTRLIVDTHDAQAFTAIGSLTVGEFREWLLDLQRIRMCWRGRPLELRRRWRRRVSKLMRNQDLILAGQKCRVVTRFRNTLGLPDGYRCGCSRIIRRTMCAGLPRRCWRTAVRMRRCGDRGESRIGQFAGGDAAAGDDECVSRAL